MSARFRKTRRYTKVVCCVLNLCTRFFHRKVQGDQILHAMSARFRKTRRYTKVVCCVLNLCTRFFHRKVQGDQILHAMSARFRKTRRYTKVVCCVLNLCTRFFHQKIRVDQTIHAVSARFRKTRRYTKVVCCVLMVWYGGYPRAYLLFPSTSSAAGPFSFIVCSVLRGWIWSIRVLLIELRSYPPCPIQLLVTRVAGGTGDHSK